MSGVNVKPQTQLAQQQQQAFGQELGLSFQDRGLMESLIAPIIQFNQGLTSGDPSKVTEAAGPLLSQISSQFASAGENIRDTRPRGAGSDFALQMLPIQEANATAGALSNAALGGFQNLTNIASGQGQLALGELGGGLRAGEGASSSNQSVMQAQAAQKQATMSFLGDIVKSAGMAASGGVFGTLGGGGGGGGGGYNPDSGFFNSSTSTTTLPNPFGFNFG